MSESIIVADRRHGVVVWTMSPEIARFYAEKLRSHAGTDAGVRADMHNLSLQADLADQSADVF